MRPRPRSLCQAGHQVVKTPDKTEVKADGSVTYTYEVSNTGDTRCST